MTDPFEQFDIEINDDTNDSGSVDTAVKEAVKAIEQEPEIKEVEQQEVETSEADDFNPEGYSNAALFALSFQKEKGIFPEDVEIKKDLTPEELQQMLLEAAERKVKGEDEEYLSKREEEALQRLQEKGLTDSHYTYLQQIINGADPQIVSRVAQYRSWADAELEDSEEMEAAIRAGLRLQLSNNPNADDLIEAFMEKNIKDKGEDVLREQAEKFQGYIGQVADYLEEQDTKRIETQKAQVREAEERFASDTQKQIEAGVYGITWKKPEQKKLHEYMTKKVVTAEINGRKEKITQEHADILKDRNDISKRVFEAYQRMTGFTKLTNAAAQTAQDKFLKSLKAQEEPKRTTIPLPRANKEDVLDQFEFEI